MQKGGHLPPLFLRFTNRNRSTGLVPVTLTTAHGFGVFGTSGATAGSVFNRNQSNATIFHYTDGVIVGRQLLAIFQIIERPVWWCDLALRSKTPGQP